jgi:hypothetical protein
MHCSSPTYLPCHMAHQSRISLFEHWNNIWRGAQIMTLLAVLSPAVPRRAVPLRPKHFPQPTVRKHPQLAHDLFLPSSQTIHCSLTSNLSTLYVWVTDGQIPKYIKRLICEWSHNLKTRKRKSRPIRECALTRLTKKRPPDAQRPLPRQPHLRRLTVGQGREQRLAVITFKKSNKTPPVLQQIR